MEKYLLTGLFLFLSGCSLFERKDNVLRREITDLDVRQKGGDEAYKKRLLVLPVLDANSDRDPELLQQVHQALIHELMRTGEVIALGPQEVSQFKLGVTKTGEYPMGEMAKPLKDTGISTIVEGKILDLRIKRKADPIGVVRKMKVTFECVIRMRMVSVKTQKEIFNTVKTVTLHEDNVRVAERVESDAQLQNNPELIKIIVKDAFYDFIPQVLGALTQVSWEGRIAAIQGDRMFLNVGRVSGIQIGDLLKVVDAGSDIYDPEGGQHIGRVPGRLKGTLEVISYFGQDGAIAVIHSGAQFKENDKVELY